MIAELDPVALTRDVPASHLESGDVGAVVHAYGTRAYEVEFVTGRGETLAVLTLTPSDIRPLHPLEVLHARSQKPPTVR